MLHRAPIVGRPGKARRARRRDVRVRCVLAVLAGLFHGRTALAQTAPSAGSPAGPRPATASSRRATAELYVPGLVLFGSAYVAGIPLTGVLADANGSKYGRSHAAVMAIPFAGPWLEVAGVVERESRSGGAWLATAGILQIVAAALTITGLAVEHDVPNQRALGGFTVALFTTLRGAGGLSLGRRF